MRRPVPLNALIGGCLIGALMLTAAAALIWTPYDPLAVNLRARMVPPGGAYLLGTDEFGRDVLSRLMAGAASSAIVALTTVAFAVVDGGTLGLVAGFLRGWTDRISSFDNPAGLTVQVCSQENFRFCRTYTTGASSLGDYDNYIASIRVR